MYSKMNRSERRKLKIDQHRLRISQSIQERRKLFFEMTDAFLAGKYYMNPDVDTEDFMFNTELFQSECERYFLLVVAADAFIHAPDDVRTLNQHYNAEQNFINTEEEYVEELIVPVFDGRVVTIAHDNYQDVGQVSHISSESILVLQAITQLPPEIQLSVTNNLPCVSKLIAKSIVPHLCVEPCRKPSLISYHPDQHMIVEELSDSNVISQVFHPTISEKIPIEIMSVNGIDFLLPTHKSLPFSDYYGKAYNRKRNLKDVSDTCICQSLLFRYPHLLADPCVTKSLRLTGYRPPRGKHISVWSTNNGH